ncbi:MAG TPA: hypothetical protein VKW77_00745 [Acidimicrobiales bacterium]|nr:hypothetical protein [Acidimicrobiales bacterium]
MRHGSTIVPAGLILVAALLGAGGSEAPPADGVSVLDERFGLPVAPIYLLLRPDVQLDLRLNQRQITGARELVAQLVERLLALKNKTGQASLSERRRIDEAMAAWLRRELSEVQEERLTQISLQWEGASALRRPSVAEYLALGEAQRLRIDHLLTVRDRRRAAGGLAPGEFDRSSREALAVLTPPQRERWEGLLGPACRFSIGRPAGAARGPASAPDLKGRPRSPGR